MCPKGRTPSTKIHIMLYRKQYMRRMHMHRPLAGYFAKRSEAMETAKGQNDRLCLCMRVIAPLGVFKTIAGNEKAANLTKD